MTPEHGRSAASSPGHGHTVPARERGQPAPWVILCALIVIGMLAGRARAQEAPTGGATNQDSTAVGTPSDSEPAVADSAAAAPAPPPVTAAPPPAPQPDLDAPPPSE